MAASMSDTKKKELDSREQLDNTATVTATTTANDYYGSSSNPVETTAVQVPDSGGPQQARVVAGFDGHSVGQQAPGLVVVHEHVYRPAGDLSSFGDCCYKISVEDPVEVVHARNIAIAHVVFEFLAVFTCLTNGFCIWFFVLAMVSSSLVACCIKQRTAYSCWSFMGLFLVCVHALLGLDEASASGAGANIAVVMQGFLCIVSVVVVIVGCRAASATGGRALLERRQAGMPMQGLSQMGQRVPLSQVDSHA